MKLPMTRGKLTAWFHACTLSLAVVCGISPQSTLASDYPKEYIRIQPQSVIVREGGSAGFDVEYAFGTELADLTPVHWYRNGEFVGSTLPVLQTYNTDDGPKPKLWDPYYSNGRGAIYDDAASVQGASSNARARWVAGFSIPVVSAKDVGMYQAKIGDVNDRTDWTYTNFVQLVLVPTDPAKAMEIVRHPSNRSVSAPNSNPTPILSLYGDMRSRVSPIMNTPFGAATNAEGFTFVADTLNHCIRRVSPGGRVTTLAGMDGQPSSYTETIQVTPLVRARTRKERDPVPGHQNGETNQSLVSTDPTAYRFRSTESDLLGSDGDPEPKFRAPEGIAVSDIDVVYVADTGNHAIRRIRTVGNVTTVDDLYGDPTSTVLRNPRGVFFAGSSTAPSDPPVLYVLDSSNYSVKKLYLNPVDGSLDTTKGVAGCENIAGIGPTPGWQGITVSASDAKFYSPRGIVFTRDPATGADTLYIADTVNHVIRQIVMQANQWTARTVVGFVGAKGNVNAVGTAARLNFPVGLALDEANEMLYFTEFGNHSLRRVYLPFNSRRIAPWTVDTVAGSGFYGPTLFGPNGAQGIGNGDGLGTAAVFYYPAGISFNKVDGSILLADTNNHVLRKVRIPIEGANAWLGESAAFAGTVGVAGNRDFASLPEFSYEWKKDAKMLTDNVPPVAASSVSGSLTDTLVVQNVQYDDAGVYALVVTDHFDRKVETSQAFVYVAIEGDRPKFLDPGYRIVEQTRPNEPLVDLQKGMNIFVSADILPADQVTYQWEVAEDTGGNFDWVALSDLPFELQTVPDPGDPDPVKNENRTKLGRLLGTPPPPTTPAPTLTTISGSTTARLAITQLQSSLTGVPPKLRFRVRAAMRSDPDMQLDTRVEKIDMRATWTVVPSQTVAVATSSGTLSPGMILSGTLFPQGTRITAVSGGTLTLDTLASRDQNTPATFTAAVLTGTLLTGTVTVTGSWTVVPQTVTLDSAYNLSEKMHLVAPGSLFADNTIIERIDSPTPGSAVLYLSKPALLPGTTNKQIAAAEDLAVGTGLSIRYPAGFPTESSRNLSYTVDGSAPTAAPINGGAMVSIFLTAGSSAVIGNPAPDLLWYKRDTLTSTGTLVGTGTSYTIPSVSTSHRGFYSVTAINSVLPPDGKPAVSTDLFLDVARPPTLKVLSMNSDGGSVVAGGTTMVARVVDKTKDPKISLTVNVDATQPQYEWSFVPAGQTTPLTDLSRFGPVFNNQLTSGSLSIANYPIDGDGVFTAKITVAGTAAASVSWNVVVKALPEYVANPPSKVFKVGDLDINGDSAEVDLNEVKSLFLKADFQSPITLPLRYKWRRDSTIVSSGTSNSLSVSRLGRVDMGAYRLEVSNDMGSRVLGSVIGSEQPFPGAPAGWRLQASGKPSVTVQPLGKLLTASTPNLSAAFAGMVAAGPRAAAVSAAGPVPPTPLRVSNVGQQRLALQVAAEGSPHPSYQWYRKTIYSPNPWSPVPWKILGAISPIYVPPSFTPLLDPSGTEYVYYAQITNSLLAGLPLVTSDEIRVRVDGPPDPVISAPASENPGLVATAVPPITGGTFTAGGTVTLSAVVTDKGAEYSYQWKVNGNPILGAGTQKLTLPNIDPGQAGSYTVVATGVAGTRESAAYAVAVTTAGTAGRYALSLSGFEQMRMAPIVTPTLTSAGFAPGTKVTISGIAPSDKLLQGWKVSYTKANNETVSVRLPARAAQFVMPAAIVSVSPVLSRPYSGTYTGLLTLEAPWIIGDEWPVELIEFDDLSRTKGFFRPKALDMALGKVRGLFTCSVSATGAVSGQIQIENRTMGFTTVLDAEMRGTFRITTTLRGTVWNLDGSITFNPTQENAAQDYVDNVVHVVLKDVLMATPPVIPVGQTLYCAAAGVSGAAQALSADLQEAETAQSASATPMSFTAAAYREANGETKESSYGQAAVLSAQIRSGTGAVILRGYLANGTKVTAASVLGRAFITPQMEGPDVLRLIDPFRESIYPALEAAAPFKPTSEMLSGQATEALSEFLLRRSTSQSFPIWLRGDSATAPVYGAMIFNGPRVYGCLGTVGLNLANKVSEYTPNLIAGYFYDSQAPQLANLPSNAVNTDQINPIVTIPGSLLYPGTLAVNWPTSPVAPQPDVVQISVDRETGLLFGGMLESTAKYLHFDGRPSFAGGKPLLACTTAAVFIQRGDILPFYPWTPSYVGGYVGFIYRGKNAPLEPLKNVLGTGAPEVSPLPATNGASRIEALRITIENRY